MATTDPPSWPEHFVEEMKRARVRAGYASQRELGEAIGWSRSRIADIESGRFLPPLEMVEALDATLSTDAQLSRIWAKAKRAAVSTWIAEYFELEERAGRIRGFQPSLPHGLLQTRETATAILASRRYAPGLNGVSVDEQVALRLQRQRILTSGTLRSLWVVLDEAVIRRAIGGPEVIKGQLRHYLDVMENGVVGIQILPYGAGASIASAAFSVLEIPGRGTFTHFDGPLTGTTTDQADTVAGCEAVFDALRSDTLSLNDSAALIQSRMEEL